MGHAAFDTNGVTGHSETCQTLRIMIRARSCMLMAVVAALVVVLIPIRMDGCPIVVTEQVQRMAQGAAIIAEATAADTRHHFDITKVWKGSPPPRVSLTQDQFDPNSSCYVGPTTPGASYLLYIGCDEPASGGEFAEYRCVARSFAVPLTAENLAFLEHPKAMSKREVAAMLRDWMAGKTPTAAVAKWVAEIKDIAAFDDWITIGGDEGSLSLAVVLELDILLNHRDLDLEEPSCAIAAMRTKVTPTVLKVMKQATPTEAQVEMLDELFLSVEDCE